MTLKFVREVTGEKMSTEEVKEALQISIEAATHALTSLIDFRTKLENSVLDAGDSFLDFSIAETEGYDRTGPSAVMVEEEDSDE